MPRKAKAVTESATVVTKAPKVVTDWAAIRVEWELGQLDLREIARQHGITHTAILKRSQRKAWPPRGEKVQCVTALVTKLSREADTVTTPRHAIMAFERVIGLLTRHRKMFLKTEEQLARCQQAVDNYLAVAENERRPLRLDEINYIANIGATVAQAMAKIVPLHRRAFGLVDDEGPSEFDAFTTSEMDAVENVVRKALD